MEDRQSRLFLALFLSLGIWMGVSYFFGPPPKPQGSKTTNQEKVGDNKELGTPNKDASKDSNGKNPLDPSQKKETEAQKLPEIPKDKIQTIYVKNDSSIVKLTSLGGRIEEYYIKNYKDTEGIEVEIVKFDKDQIEVNGEKIKGIEISRGKGFDFNFSNSQYELSNSPFNQINFSVSQDPTGKIITFKANSPDGKYLVTKTYTFFEKENYFLFDISFQNISGGKIALAKPDAPLYFRSYGSLGPVPLDRELTDREKTNYFRYFYLDKTFDTFQDGSSAEGFFARMMSSKPASERQFEIKTGKDDLVDFVGTGSRYFIAVLDPLTHKVNSLLLDNREKKETGVVLIYDTIELGSEPLHFTYANYLGIRETDGMKFRNKDLDPSLNKSSPFTGISSALDKSFNQGITTPFRNGIVWILKKLHDFVIPNYGWCIILFSVLFKLAFYPLNQKQADSMKKMQELSPQIQALSEKYKDDPQTKQTKIMELYKKNGTNPLSGCLPMLIQIPIFIALYTAFSDTIDLWHSPFLWIKDLSEPDVIFSLPANLPIIGGIGLSVLPLVMVGTQFLQSKMTSVPTDPNQKMMLYMMPVLMLYFFWSMPSGVTLYWTTQNILSILQQYITNHITRKKDKAPSNVVSMKPANNPRTNSNSKKGK